MIEYRNGTPSGRPLRTRPMARVFFYGLQDRSDLRPAACELRLFHEFVAAQPHLSPRKAKEAVALRQPLFITN